MLYRILYDNKFPLVADCTFRTDITAADTFDVLSLPADLTNKLITVSKQGILVVAAEQATSGGTVTISPIVYDTSGPNPDSILSILPPKTFIQPYAFRRGVGSGTYILPYQSQDVLGSWKIGLHVSAISGTNNVVKICGLLI